MDAANMTQEEAFRLMSRKKTPSKTSSRPPAKPPTEAAAARRLQKLSPPPSKEHQPETRSPGMLYGQGKDFKDTCQAKHILEIGP